MASSIIASVQTTSGNQPRMRRIIEKSGQTFLSGVPVEISAADGGIQEWAGTPATDSIAGFSKEFANNLSTTGVAKQIQQGTVPNQPNAQNIMRPYFNDGTIGFEVADGDTVFLAQVGPAQTALVTDVGKHYGMTKDADGHWYVDKTKTTVGTNTVCTVVKLDPNDQSATPRGVYITIDPANAQIVA
jgi:hypothetical protein